MDYKFDKTTGTLEEYLGSENAVVIPSEIDGVAVKHIGGSAFANKGLLSVVLPDSLEVIRDYAFEGNNITKLTVPKSVVKINSYAFSKNCLEELVLFEGLIKIGRHAFSDNFLKTVIIPESVKTIWKGAFIGNNLKEVIVLHNEQNKEDRFDKEILDIGFPPNMSKGVNVTKNGFAFKAKTKTIVKYVGEQKEIVIPSEIDGVKVEVIGKGAFENRGLTRVTIPDTVTTIRQQGFRGNELTEIVIPDSVTKMEWDVFQENKLQKIKFSENLDVIDRWCFEGNKLTHIEIPKNIKKIGGSSSAFGGNPLKVIKLTKNIEEIGGYEPFGDINKIIYNLGKNIANYENSEVVETLITILLHMEIDEVTIIEAFKNYLEFENDFRELLEYKNKGIQRVANYLLKCIEVERVASKSVQEQLDYLKSSVTKDASKKLQMMDLNDLPTVRLKDEKEVDKEVVTACIGAFLPNNLIIVPSENKIIEQLFNKDDLSNLAQYILNKCVDSEMDNKLKTMLVFCTYYASDELIYKIKDLVNEVVKANRYKAAQQILQAIAYNGSKLSFMLLDEISSKGKTKGQKEEAKRLLEKAARINEVKLDDLLDMIVPDFGFDDNGVLSLSNDETSIDILLENDGKVTFRNEAGKTVKTLPKRAECFKKDINNLKKQIKTVYKTQEIRLQKAFISGRKWDKDTFASLFVKNPIMRQISKGIIFAIKTTDNNKQTVVVTSEKTLETANYNEINIDDISQVFLMHSVEETAETLKEWKTYLKDNDLKPSFDQLSMKPYDLSDEKDIFRISKYVGYKQAGTSKELRGIQTKIEKLGFEKDDVESGYISDYNLKIDSLDLVVNLSFDQGFYVEMEYTEEIEVGSIQFIDTNSNDIEKVISLPSRIYSTVIYELDKIFK